MSLPAKVVPEGAGRYDHLHGDEDTVWPTAADECAIEALATQKLEERLYHDQVQFDDLLAGIDPADYQPQLQRMLANLRAPNFNRVSVDAITTALHQIDRIVRTEAERVWLDDLRDEAASEVLGVI